MILVDLNVVLDVVQKRKAGYAASAALLEQIIDGELEAVVPAHAVTTIHYLVSKYQDAVTADRVVDWLLRYFGIASVGHGELQRARALDWSDFEDAVVAAAAESAGCSTILTQNVKDFADSGIPAMTPAEYLQLRQ